MNRPRVTNDMLDRALDHVEGRTLSNMAKHGPGAFLTLEEVRQALDEEVREFLVEVERGERENARYELLDIAALVLFALAGWEAVHA
jgi:hypothetical protein